MLTFYRPSRLSWFNMIGGVSSLKDRSLVVQSRIWALKMFYVSLLSGIERSSWLDSWPEWGRSKISPGNWPPHFIHSSVSLIFPACSVSEMWESMSIWNVVSASFWQRVTTTAPFEDSLLRKAFLLDQHFYQNVQLRKKIFMILKGEFANCTFIRRCL